MRDRLIELLCNAQKKEVIYFGRQCGKIYNTAETIADYLLEKGVMVLDTEKVDVALNLKPLATAFGMPLNELAELIRAREEGRLIVLPYKVGDIVYHIGEHIRIADSGWTTIPRIMAEKFHYGMLDWKYTTLYSTREEAEQALKSGGNK